MSHIQLPYGLVCKEKKLNLNLLQNYNVGQYIKGLLYLEDRNDPTFQNSIIDIVNNRADFRKFLLGTSNYGRNFQENINTVVTDGTFNNAVVSCLLDERNKGVFQSPFPLSTKFKDAKKFDVQIPVIGNILSQGNANQLIDAQVKELLGEGEDSKIRVILDALRSGSDSSGGDGGGNGPLTSAPLPPLP